MFSIKTFRYVALAEATSFLILLVVAYVVPVSYTHLTLPTNREV